METRDTVDTELIGPHDHMWSSIPLKSQMLGITFKEKLTNDVFNFQKPKIPTIQENGLQCFGKNYDCSFKDNGNAKDTRTQLNN